MLRRGSGSLVAVAAAAAVFIKESTRQGSARGDEFQLANAARVLMLRVHCTRGVHPKRAKFFRMSMHPNDQGGPDATVFELPPSETEAVPADVHETATIIEPELAALPEDADAEQER